MKTRGMQERKPWHKDQLLIDKMIENIGRSA